MGRHSVVSIGDSRYKLTVIDILPSNKSGKHAKIKVKCECGIEKLMQTPIYLRSKSCGCSRYDPNVIKKRDSSTYHRLEDATEAAFNMLYTTQYKYRAEKNGYSFDLTKESFKLHTKENCIHCGIEPHRVARCGKSEYIYNGLDRVDNAKGYTEDNIVACCWDCNQAKHNKTNTQFEQWLERIVKYRNSQQGFPFSIPFIVK